MKLKLILITLALCLGYNTNANSQISDILQMKIQRDYERVLKTLSVAEKIQKNGGIINIDQAEIKLNKIKKLNPNFDTSLADAKIAGFKSNDFDYDSWKKLSSIIATYKRDRGVKVFMDDKLLEHSKKIDLDEIKSILSKKKEEGELDFDSATIDEVISDFPDYIKNGGVYNLFMAQLDQLVPRSGSSNPTVTVQKAGDLKKRAEALYAFAGDTNEDVKAIVKSIDKVIENAQGDMSAVLTSDFHKEHLGKIVFSSAPFTIGSESKNNIKTEFKTGEPIYGTVYFGRTLGDMLKTANYTKNGVTNFDVRFFKEDGNRIVGQAEKWEIDSYAFHDDITVHRNQLGQSYIQFILLPKSVSELSQYAKIHNYTPVIFMRALASMPPRQIKMKLKFNHVDVSGMHQEFEGGFSINLSEGHGPDFYEKEQHKLIDKYIENNELPSAGMNNTALEQQMISHMNGKGWQETFVDAIIEQSDWTVEYELGKPVRKIINTFMVAKHPDGYCFYHNYGFESRPTGNGWSAPQYRSSGARTRILCSKIK